MDKESYYVLYAFLNDNQMTKEDWINFILYDKTVLGTLNSGSEMQKAISVAQMQIWPPKN